MTRRTVAAVLVIGLLAGAALAAFHGPDGAAAPRAQVPATAPQAPAPRVDPGRPGRLRDGRYRGSYVHLRIDRASIRTVATAADPAGGPRWALRRFRAERVLLDRPARSLVGAKVIGRNRCLQVGRLGGGRFGWVYADGRFHAGRVEPLTYVCGSRKRPRTDVRTTQVVTPPLAAVPSLGVTAVWGQAPGARAVTVGGAPVPLRSRGALLTLRDDPRGVDAGAIRVDGRALRGSAPGPLRGVSPAGSSPVRPGTARIAARTPDPLGGLPWGVGVATTEAGFPCVASIAARVVDDRLGAVNRRMGIFLPAQRNTGVCLPPDVAFARDRPCAFGTSGGGYTGRKRPDVVTRQPPGGVTVAGSCAPDVVRLTLRTPRDIRTLTPSRDGHAFVAVYAGGFVAGSLTLTAIRRDGSRTRQTFELPTF